MNTNKAEDGRETGKADFSKNELAEKIVGTRDIKPGTIIFDQPCELGYKCPVCKYKAIVRGNYDERLHWSEYNDFLWCSVCNYDYPSALCMPDKKRATQTYLETVADAVARKPSPPQENHQEPIKELIEALERIKCAAMIENNQPDIYKIATNALNKYKGGLDLN